MAYRLLKEIIAGRNVSEIKYSEAKRIVDEFFIRWNRMTFGQRNQQKVDYLAGQALKRAGLECFA